MAVRQASRNFVLGWVVGGVLFCGFAAGVVLIMFVLAGKFSPKVPAAWGGDRVGRGSDRRPGGASQQGTAAGVRIGRGHDPRRARERPARSCWRASWRSTSRPARR